MTSCLQSMSASLATSMVIMNDTPPPLPSRSLRRKPVTPPTSPPTKELPALPSASTQGPTIDEIQTRIERISDELFSPDRPRPDSPTRPELREACMLLAYGETPPSFDKTANQEKVVETRLSGLMKHFHLSRRKSSITSQASSGKASQNSKLPPRATIHDSSNWLNNKHFEDRLEPSAATSTSLKSFLLGPIGAATAAEVQIVLIAINTAREQHGSPPLNMSNFLCESAARYAKQFAERHKPPERTINVVFQVRHMAWPGDGTRLEHAEIPSGVERPATLKIVRLISAPLGALAVGERWVSGKFKEHLSSVDPRVHLKYCACLEFAAWKVIMDARHTKMGLARDEHGQWIAEFLVDNYRPKAIPLIPPRSFSDFDMEPAADFN